MLQAYYDGSGKSKSEATQLLTLAGVAAPEHLWPHFAALWGEVLDRHHLDAWHTAEAMSGKHRRRGFVKPPWRDQWDSGRASAAMAELRALIFRFVSEHWPVNFQMRVCTVNMEDYRAAKEQNPFLRPAEAICVNACVGDLELPGPEVDRIQLYFDSGEDFMKQVEQVWMKDRKKPHIRWANQITLIKMSSAESAAIQAADLLAWEFTQKWRGITEPEGVRVRLWNTSISYYDREAIEKRYTPERERARAERIRRAGRRTPETRRLDEG
jgi:hypothetical protein